MHMYPHFGAASWAPLLSLQYFNSLMGYSQINRQIAWQIISLLWTWLLESIMNSTRTSGFTRKLLTKFSVRLNRSFCQISPRHTQVITVQPKHSINFARGTWSTGNLAHQPVGWKDPRSSSLQLLTHAVRPWDRRMNQLLLEESHSQLPYLYDHKRRHLGYHLSIHKEANGKILQHVFCNLQK